VTSTQLSPGTVKALLREENALRLCDDTLALYVEARKRGADPSCIPEMIQREVARRFGVSEQVAIEAMRCAETLPQMSSTDVAEVREISHYRKYNRCKDGSLQVGHSAPLDVDLWRLPPPSSASAPLVPSTLGMVHAAANSGFRAMPLVLMAASYS
jgi:hypothetical protein